MHYSPGHPPLQQVRVHGHRAHREYHTGDGGLKYLELWQGLLQQDIVYVVCKQKGGTLSEEAKAFSKDSHLKWYPVKEFYINKI